MRQISEEPPGQTCQEGRGTLSAARTAGHAHSQTQAALLPDGHSLPPDHSPIGKSSIFISFHLANVSIF